MNRQSAEAFTTPEDTWQALLYFNLYKVVLGLLLMALLVAGWVPQPLPLADTRAYVYLDLVYLGFALAAVGLAHRRILTPAHLGVAGVLTDVSLLGAMHYYSSGVGSGFDVLMLVSVAGHSILAGGGIVFLYAAVATLVVLGVELYLYFAHLPVLANFSFAGFFSLSLFVIAYGGKLLAARLKRSEALVRHHSEQLRELAHLNEQIVGIMQAGVVLIDGEGRVVLMNPAARRILACTGEVHGRTLAQVSPALSRLDAAATTAQAVVPSNLSLGEHEYQVTALHPGATDRGTLLVLEESHTVRTRALQLKRAALSRLAAGISHELRNPLAALTQAVQLLEGAESLPEQERKLTHVIKRQSRRMDRIIENVLQLAREARPRGEILPLHAWLLEFKREFLEMHRLRETEVQVCVDPEHLAIYMDPTQLHQVLWNLGENALRYSKRSPKLTLRAQQEPLTGRPHLDIIDRGTGMDPQCAHRLFEPFFTTEAEGSGLGLYLANELCEANNALLSLHSNTPEGCHFRIGFNTPLTTAGPTEE